MHLARRSCRVPFTKTLLTYQLLLVFAGFLVLATGVFLLAFFDTATGRRVAVTVPRAIGHVNMLTLAVLFLPVSRVSPVLAWLGLRFETAIQMHTLLGRCFMLFVLAHSATMMALWAAGTMGPLLAEHLVGMVAAFVALAAVAAMAAVSWFRLVRHLAFELFYFVHHLFVVVVAASCLHAMAMMANFDGSVDWNQDLPIYYFVAPLVIYAIDRVWRVVRSARPVELAAFEVHDQVVKLRLSCAEHSPFFPGSFAFLCCPSVSRVEWHPFSASAIDRRANLVEFDVLRVGGEDSWSARLLQRARGAGESFSANNTVGLEQTGSDVELLFEESLAFRVDGPYGDDLRLEEYTGVVFVAGGIGLTSLMPVYRDYARGDKNIRFVYLFRRSGFAAHEAFFAGLEHRDHFVFVETQPGGGGGEEAAVPEEWPHSAVRRGEGRPDVRGLVGAAAGRVCVVCCGPESLARDAGLMAHERGWDFVSLSFFY